MAKQEPRRSRDAAGVGPYAREREQLVPLGELRGWNIVGGDADIRSWEVKTLSGKVLGSVRELLVDPDAREVVLIDIDLSGTSRHAYVPIRVAEVDRVRRLVRVDSGDLEEHDGLSDRTRLSEQELERVGDRDVSAAATRERVIERKPIVEETVVRRRELGNADRDVEGLDVDDPEARP